MDRINAMLHPRASQRVAAQAPTPSPQATQHYPPHSTPPRPSSAAYSQAQPYGATASSGFAGGFQAQRPPPGPPLGADPQLWHWFTSVDLDRSGSISASELQTALVNGNWSQFDLDTIKMLMNLFDTDRSGTIAFTEFVGLWKYISDWQGVFRHFDKDRSGEIDSRELGDALRSFGYSLSPQTVEMVAQKYSSLPGIGRATRHPSISFDRFVRACVTIKSLTESFQRVDTDNDGWVQIDYDSFLRIVLKAP